MRATRRRSASRRSRPSGRRSTRSTSTTTAARPTRPAASRRRRSPASAWGRASTSRTCSAAEPRRLQDAVRRAGHLPGRHQLRLDQHRLRNDVFTTDGTLSTVEVVNIMLGAGNDNLSDPEHAPAGRRLQPGHRRARRARPPRRRDRRAGRRERTADGRRHVHARGSGRRPRRLGLQARAQRRPRLGTYGFVVGQQITLPDGHSYTITGIAPTVLHGPGDTLLVGGGRGGSRRDPER